MYVKNLVQHPDFTSWGRKLVQAFIGLVILFVAHLVILMITRRIVKQMESNNKKLAAYNLIINTIYWVFMLGVIIIVVSWLGIEVAALIALLGSVLFAIGLGLQGSLGDLAAGCILMVANNYKIGDFIEIPSESMTGTVKDFNLIFTEVIDEESGVLITVPNRKIYENIMVNNSTTTQNVVVAEVVVSNKNLDLTPVLNTLEKVVTDHPGVLSNLPVRSKIANVGALGTTIEVRYALTPKDFMVEGTYSKQTEIMTLIREVLIAMQVQLVDIGMNANALVAMSQNKNRYS